jgi:hypothetical protein
MRLSGSETRSETQPRGETTMATVTYASNPSKADIVEFLQSTAFCFRHTFETVERTCARLGVTAVLVTDDGVEMFCDGSSVQPVICKGVPQ